MDPKSGEWLAAVGILETYQRLKVAYSKKVWLDLSPEIKEEAINILQLAEGQIR